MELYYRSEHLSCSHYSTSHTSIFKLLDCEKGVVISRKYIDETFIVFILKGKLSINYDSEHPMDVGEGNAFLLPKNLDVKAFVLDTCSLVLCSFTSDLKLCSRFFIQELNSFLPSSSDVHFFIVAVPLRFTSYESPVLLSSGEVLGSKPIAEAAPDIVTSIVFACKRLVIIFSEAFFITVTCTSPLLRFKTALILFVSALYTPSPASPSIFNLPPV